MSLPCMPNDTRIPPVRLPAALLQALRGHVEEQGETLPEFVRRAIRQTIARDHLTRRLQAAREAFRHEVFVTVTEEGD